jgi:mannose-6-phosphate isomerase-like protein (cupin superfamily)
VRLGNSFSSFRWLNGFLAELHGGVAGGDRNSLLYSWQGKLDLDAEGTHYVYCHQGPASVRRGPHGALLYSGMFASMPGAISIEGGCGIVITRLRWYGDTLFGGPAPYEGRMRYIDGCTDSLLLPPPMKGDPCLNLLYFPPGIDQTMHTHPSDRIGMILSGKGQCEAPEGRVDLEPGMIFCIHADGQHRFRTPYNCDMRVLAYHPDSDFGPTHEDHPMLNRTIIEGVSAAAPERAAFRTKEAA